MVADNATLFLNVVIGTSDEKHVFHENITVEENERLVALHFTVVAPTASDCINLCFHRGEVMTTPHATRPHLMAKRFCETLLFQTESVREALSQRICDTYVVW